MGNIYKLDPEKKLERISKEKRKLNSLFKEMELKTRKAVNSLIDNAAFMSVSLEELQNEINHEGYTEEYTNGANQSGVKESSAVKVYNTTVKNYMGVMKQLTDLLPKPTGGSAPNGEQKPDDLKAFVQRRNEM